LSKERLAAHGPYQNVLWNQAHIHVEEVWDFGNKRRVCDREENEEQSRGGVFILSCTLDYAL